MITARLLNAAKWAKGACTKKKHTIKNHKQVRFPKSAMLSTHLTASHGLSVTLMAVYDQGRVGI